MEKDSSKYDLDAVNMISSGNEVFNKKLLPILLKNGGNLVYSPLSAHAILSLAYQGAAGETAKSLENVLKLSDVKTVAEGYKFWMENLNSLKREKVKIANKIYINEQYQLKEKFSSVAKKYFLSEAENINFGNPTEAAIKINKWIEKETEGLIRATMDSDELDDDVSLLMINAIYFKGEWVYKFTKTDEAKFYISDIDTVDCTMMQGVKRLSYGEDDCLDAQILKMPYVGNNTSLLVILPRSKTGINKLCDKLQYKNLSELNNCLYTTDVTISLPKCRIKTTLQLNGALSEMGLVGMFNDGAQFPNMLNNSTPLKVSKIVQKAYIDITEAGTEAAVETSLFMRKYASWQPDLKEAVFNADHPYVFCLCYHHEQILLPIFVGVLKRPSKELSANVTHTVPEWLKRCELDSEHQSE